MDNETREALFKRARFCRNIADNHPDKGKGGPCVASGAYVWNRGAQQANAAVVESWHLRARIYAAIGDGADADDLRAQLIAEYAGWVDALGGARFESLIKDTIRSACGFP